MVLDGKLVRIVVYDCDGVLFDSKRANAAFYNRVLERFSLPHMTPAQLEFVHVSTTEEAIDYLFSNSPLGKDALEFAKTVNNDPFIALMDMEPHVIETLESLRPRYATAIATNRGRSMPQVLREHGLEHLFDFVVTTNDVKNPKPHPESLLKILNHFNVQPGEAVYIGDAEVDQQLARAAHVPFMAYKNPALHAPVNLQDHLDLLKILEGRAL